MAHAARLQDLTRKLVDGVRPDNVDNSPITHEAFRRLKDTTRSRVNPFEIESQLFGLVEKFSIVNREDLSDSLQTCLDRLSLRSGWIPEVLSLLLELSDRPATQVLPSLVSGVTSNDGTLSWDDILAQEPLDEDGVWDDVERGYHSSGDDRTDVDDVESEHTKSTEATSMTDHDATALAQSYLVQPDFAGLDRLTEVQSHPRSEASSDEKVITTELTMVRETLDMLLGLPTTTYDITADFGMQLNLRSTSSSSTDDLRLQFLEVAHDVQQLRAWTRIETRGPLDQAVQSAVQVELQRFNHEISRIIQRHLHLDGETVVSMIGVKAAVDDTARRVAPLARVIIAPEHGSHPSGTQLLQDLYDATCRVHLLEDDISLDVLGAAFIAGLQTYLTQVGEWMTMGKIPAEEHFFVQSCDAQCPAGRLWTERYALRKHGNSYLFAPSFLYLSIDEIFSTGKSRALLDLIDGSSKHGERSPAGIAFITVRHIRDRLALEPLFPIEELLEATLRSWIMPIGAQAINDLNRAIDQNSELWLTVEALRPLFFASDGPQFNAASHGLLAALSRTRGDDYMLTKIVQATLGTAHAVDAGSIIVRVREMESKTSRARSLERIQLQYDLPWLLQNIAQKEGLTLHPKIFTLLLQLEQALVQVREAAPGLRNDRSYSGNFLRLRSCLLWFCNTWFSHVASTASWLHGELLAQLKAASGIDSMAKAWRSYEQRLELVLLLSDRCKPVHNAVIGILELCERLVDYSQGDARGSTDHQGSHGLGRRGIDLAALLVDFERSISFIQAGVRSISRAAGEPSLDALSSALNWRNET